MVTFSSLDYLIKAESIPLQTRPQITGTICQLHQDAEQRVHFRLCPIFVRSGHDIIAWVGFNVVPKWQEMSALDREGLYFMIFAFVNGVCV